jgi:error-prone DNA polymerase
MTERYVELHAASAFSFLEGASQPEKLVERAVELEMPAMALLDRNGVYGSARFHTSAKRNNVRAHVGAEIAVSSFGSRLVPPACRSHLGLRITVLRSHLHAWSILPERKGFLGQQIN